MEVKPSIIIIINSNGVTMSEYNYLFGVASSRLEQYIDANMNIKEEDFDMCYTDALAYVTDMLLLDLFRVLESIKYFG